MFVSTLSNPYQSPTGLPSKQPASKVHFSGGFLESLLIPGSAFIAAEFATSGQQKKCAQEKEQLKQQYQAQINQLSQQYQLNQLARPNTPMPPSLDVVV